MYHNFKLCYVQNIYDISQEFDFHNLEKIPKKKLAKQRTQKVTFILKNNPFLHLLLGQPHYTL